MKREEAQMCGIEYTGIAVSEAPPQQQIAKNFVVSQVRYTGHDMSVWGEQRDELAEDRPRIDQMFEDVPEDQAVVRLLELWQRFFQVEAEHAVQPAAGRRDRGGVPLDAMHDGAGSSLLDLLAQAAFGTSHVQEPDRFARKRIQQVAIESAVVSDGLRGADFGLLAHRRDTSRDPAQLRADRARGHRSWM